MTQPTATEPLTAEALADRLISITSLAFNLADACLEAFGDNAERFTCSEIETIAAFYRSLGQQDRAAGLLAAHADGDAEGDRHYSEENQS